LHFQKKLIAFHTLFYNNELTLKWSLLNAWWNTLKTHNQKITMHNISALKQFEYTQFLADQRNWLQHNHTLKNRLDRYLRKLVVVLSIISMTGTDVSNAENLIKTLRIIQLVMDINCIKILIRVIFVLQSILQQNKIIDKCLRRWYF